MSVIVRQTRPEDFQGIIELTLKVYPFSAPWNTGQLNSHLSVFPQGQFVAIEETNGKVKGYAASLVVEWDDYEQDGNWKDFTDRGMFTNHDTETGRTLYGAEIMVDPDERGQGIGSMLYAARERLVRTMGLLRIRAGARLRDYHNHSDYLSPQEYVHDVLAGKTNDRTLTFQIHRGFHVIDVVPGYLPNDPESLGYAAIIEWLNPEQATPQHLEVVRRSRFYKGPGK